MTQKQTNPYPYSDSNKRYQTYEYYLRHKFGRKAAKIPLDAGFSCPNIRDGAGGCIYCSPRGSGDCVANLPSLRAQYDAGRAALSSKWDTSACIAYLQAHTNTFAPAARLRPVYEEILTFPGVVGMNIATRADCLPEDVCLLLREISERTVLTVELGLQSSNDETAARIRRGHTFAQFREGYARLRELVPKAEICVHIILGLPGEDEKTMMRTADDVAALHPNQVKIHLLHVLENTPLAETYRHGEYTPLEEADYVRLVCGTLRRLPADTAIGRVTGDGLARDLLAPLWSAKKTCVINDIDKMMYANGWIQGDLSVFH